MMYKTMTRQIALAISNGLTAVLALAMVMTVDDSIWQWMLLIGGAACGLFCWRAIREVLRIGRHLDTLDGLHDDALLRMERNLHKIHSWMEDPEKIRKRVAKGFPDGAQFMAQLRMETDSACGSYAHSRVGFLSDSFISSKAEEEEDLEFEELI